MARISEMHYSNALASSSGIPEFLEIALSPAERMQAGNFTASFYNSNGALIAEFVLTDARFVEEGTGPDPNVFFDSASNEWNYVIASDVFGTFLTDPDGNGANNAEAYALTDTSTMPNTVIDFYDIGSGTANITAIGGAADGAVSQNVPVPTSGNPNAAQGSIQYNQPNPDVAVNEPISRGASGVVCFVSGSPILTVTGSRPVEQLAEGDLIVTRDHGVRPLRWIGSTQVRGRGAYAPVRFAPGTLDNREVLHFSPQHRVMFRGASVGVNFDCAEVLVAAKDLVGLPGVTHAIMPWVRYYHLLFEGHELVYSAGAWTESFYPAHWGLSTIDSDQRREIIDLFPVLAQDGTGFGRSARRQLTSVEAATLKPCTRGGP